jgi:hypothetical protein
VGGLSMIETMSLAGIWYATLFLSVADGREMP